ncbi:Rrf2 family transcriptional regulator [Sphaerisporangium rufum]|uniref:Rrf2 family transcriptional regulator n=1 Tax=Sphaerisporangium rufum TaxID=1381558 RepID=A0A919UZT4_9ACTN|nr:Rrf2 family transcriptional regulator [Sphaerisporangium rufum]GII79391.1 Rrf2 family transcriptional regulator [Sphaerisporangium rufum]
MSEGVEWAVHCCLTLAWLGDERPVPAARLAAGYELPTAYLNKQLQALVRAGVLESVAGAKGGFRLARPLEKITLMDVVAAVEGPEDAFQCQEIRRRGMGAGAPEGRYRAPCAVSTAMRRAELAWRRALAAQTLAEIQAAAERQAPDLGRGVRRWYGQDG